MTDWVTVQERKAANDKQVKDRADLDRVIKELEDRKGGKGFKKSRLQCLQGAAWGTGKSWVLQMRDVTDSQRDSN